MLQPKKTAKFVRHTLDNSVRMISSISFLPQIGTLSIVNGYGYEYRCKCCMFHVNINTNDHYS